MKYLNCLIVVFFGCAALIILAAVLSAGVGNGKADQADSVSQTQSEPESTPTARTKKNQAKAKPTIVQNRSVSVQSGGTTIVLDEGSQGILQLGGIGVLLVCGAGFLILIFSLVPHAVGSAANLSLMTTAPLAILAGGLKWGLIIGAILVALILAFMYGGGT